MAWEIVSRSLWRVDCDCNSAANTQGKHVKLRLTQTGADGKHIADLMLGLALAERIQEQALLWGRWSTWLSLLKRICIPIWGIAVDICDLVRAEKAVASSQ